ncbi:hypothetical protein N7508_007341 [Penicillium antarcticum]|uniref:uncharacterized protein n=1 Tax=Penicillium antarcticum TaxID=416450 RepID=UPI0023A29068|nr:uncharacterized protein N7508_007341 [Penicillium antarcticum]KAJ5300098.1 hypothetical protein N7508_007341 [Penicillium antarcticum]
MEGLVLSENTSYTASKYSHGDVTSSETQCSLCCGVGKPQIVKVNKAHDDVVTFLRWLSETQGHKDGPKEMIFIESVEQVTWERVGTVKPEA